MRLTNFNSITCGGCNSIIVANRARCSLIGGLGAGIGAPLLLLSIQAGWYLVGLIWVGGIMFAGAYLHKLEVKPDEK